jgi:hypothetical protein
VRNAFGTDSQYSLLTVKGMDQFWYYFEFDDWMAFQFLRFG